MPRRYLYLLILLAVLAGILFARRPELDMAAASAFFADGSFSGRSAAARGMRQFFHYLPIAVGGIMVLAWLAARAGARLPANLVPRNRSIAFLLVTLLAGPGLLVNVVLKDNWGRPRPVHVQAFGGQMDFLPWYKAGGPCPKNCSFVSGEVSGAFWLAAPASLAPPQARTAAVAAALAIGTATAVGRMAFGGHFLSDVVFAALFTLLLIVWFRGLFFREAPPGSLDARIQSWGRRMAGVARERGRSILRALSTRRTGPPSA